MQVIVINYCLFILWLNIEPFDTVQHETLPRLEKRQIFLGISDISQYYKPFSVRELRIVVLS
jgi:hypothetical protein